MGTVRRIESRAQGCGPLIPSISEAARPLRQQIFERVRAAGYMPRVQVARELGVSPASVTTLTSELIDMGLLEEVSAQRDQGDGGRGRPAVALGVRADARLVRGDQAVGPRTYRRSSSILRAISSPMRRFRASPARSNCRSG